MISPGGAVRDSYGLNLRNYPGLKQSPTNPDCHWNDADEYGPCWRIMETRLCVDLHAPFKNPIGHPTPDVGAEYIICISTDSRIDRHKTINTRRHPPIPCLYTRLTRR